MKSALRKKKPSVDPMLAIAAGGAALILLSAAKKGAKNAKQIVKPVTCHYCQTEFSSSEERCPSCGAPKMNVGEAKDEQA